MISSGLKVTSAKSNLGTEFTLQFHLSNVGVARVTIEPGMVTLHWIEIKFAHQRKGLGSFLLDYIIDKHLPNESVLKISAVDEETLEFYFKYFKKRGLSYEDINDYLSEKDILPKLRIPASALKGNNTKTRRPM